MNYCGPEVKNQLTHFPKRSRSMSSAIRPSDQLESISDTELLNRRPLSSSYMSDSFTADVYTTQSPGHNKDAVKGMHCTIRAHGRNLLGLCQYITVLVLNNLLLFEFMNYVNPTNQ